MIGRKVATLTYAGHAANPQIRSKHFKMAKSSALLRMRVVGVAWALDHILMIGMHS